jgi:anthranilate/para-aminobenzoate synthase component I
MRLLSRVIDVAPRPLELAAAVGDRPGAFLLWSASGSGRSWVGCDPIDRSGELCPERGLPLAPTLGELGRAPRWVGVLPYEHRRVLERSERVPVERRPEPHLSRPLWLRYGAVAEIGNRVRVIGDDPAAVAALAARLARPSSPGEARLSLAEPPEAGEAHAQRIRQVLELIAKGELYQVNIARRFRLRVEGTPLALLARLGARTRPPFGAAIALGEVDVVSTSPELFLELDPSGRVWTSPIKGTRPRGADQPSDARLIDELERDPKERAELAMILDVERNDLGRIARTGSVRLLSSPRVVTHPTLHHRVATVSAQLAPGVDRTRLLEATLPSGSVTGAPKIRAMEVIAELEPVRRGLYTGAFGALRHDGGLVLAMAIRTLSVQAGEGHYHSGGGIVADSDPQRELEETHWKAVQLFSS